MKFGNNVRKLVLATAVLMAGLFFVPVSVNAASQLTADTEVYYANSKIFHLKGECGTLSTTSHMPLKDALNKGMKMCEACANEAGLDSNKAKKLTINDLPVKVNVNLAAPAKTDKNKDSSDDFEVVTSQDLNKNKDKDKNKTDKTTDKDKVTDKNSSKNTSKTDVDEDDDVEDEDDEDEDDTATTDTKKKSSNTTTSSNTTSGNSKGDGSSKVTSSSKSSNGKELLTESQRKKKFYSKTNPKRGAKPVAVQRAASAGFVYADFATFNSYASENGLGMTPIYLLGTIMQIEKVSDKGDQYGAVLMVNDCDGYQWYMRVNVAKDKYDLMKAELLGKAANIYGYYTGYSGVTRRPMMDPTIVVEVGGNSVDLSIYK